MRFTRTYQLRQTCRRRPEGRRPDVHDQLVSSYARSGDFTEATNQARLPEPTCLRTTRPKSDLPPSSWAFRPEGPNSRGPIAVESARQGRKSAHLDLGPSSGGRSTTDGTAPESLNFLGYIYALQGIQLNQAEVLIKRALVHKPDDGYYMDSLAWVYYKKGDYIRALRTQEKALEIVADDPVMMEHLGDILWRTGDKKAARNAWQKSIELKSENPNLLKRKIAEGLKEFK